MKTIIPESRLKIIYECLERLEIIYGKPEDWRLCKKELTEQFDDETIKIAKFLKKHEITTWDFERGIK